MQPVSLALRLGMSTLLHDLRYSIRRLAKARTFTAVVVATLGLGLGANAIVFSIVNGILLRPISGVSDSRDLVAVYSSERPGPLYGASSYPDYLDFRDRNTSFEKLTAYTSRSLSLSTRGRAFLILGELVTSNYFDVLGVQPRLGRAFLPAGEGNPDNNTSAVISYGLWKRVFGGQPSILGHPLRVSGGVYTVIGVAPAGFTGLNRGMDVDVWVPATTLRSVLSGSQELLNRQARSFFLIGRLRPGMSIARAQADLDLVAEQLRESYGHRDSARARARGLVTLLPLNRATVNPQIRGGISRFLGFLMVAAVLVLLICCTNLANLLLVRGAGRHREMAIRFALGASRGRLIRQLLTESLLLSIMGTALALALAEIAARLITGLTGSLPIPITVRLAPDIRVIGFAVALAVLTCVLFALIPSLRATELAPARVLHSDALGGGRAHGRTDLKDALVVIQVAVSTLLVVLAGLFARGLWRAQSLDLGFEVNEIALVPVDLSVLGYNQNRAEVFFTRLLDATRALPGIIGASMTKTIPLGMASERRGVQVEGRRSNASEYGAADVDVVEDGYFRAMGILVLQGREFTEEDDNNAPQVALVNSAFARRYWPGVSPLGRHLNTGTGPREVVGVVADGLYGPTIIGGAEPFFFLPLRQESTRDMVLVVRTVGEPASIFGALRRTFSGLDPDLPCEPRVMSQFVSFSLLPLRLAAAVLGGIGLLGILLAAVGLYGVLAYLVTRRTHEIGVRMALGLEASAVLRSVVGHSLGVVGLGLAAGLVLAIPGGLAIKGLVFGVTSVDGPICILVSAVFGLTGVVASLGPTRRATRISPAEILKSE
jgi:predicted permease